MEILSTGPENFDEAIVLRDTWFAAASNAAMETSADEARRWLDILHRVEAWLPAVRQHMTIEVRRRAYEVMPVFVVEPKGLL
jgi:hypothetical protein